MIKIKYPILILIRTLIILSIFNNFLHSGKASSSTSDTIKFFFMRHGESQWTPAMLQQGPLDLSLTEQGRYQAKTSAQLLKNLNVKKIYTSSLLRAQETSQIISRELNITPVVKTDLKERYFGDFRLLSNIEKNINSKCLPPDAEDENEFRSRVINIHKKLIEESRGEEFILVSHEKVFQVLAQELCHEDKKINFGEVYVFSYNKFSSKHWSLYKLSEEN
ncbi:MAG: histidine phosphatase family protein [Janthinobacterium lividum]